MSRLAQLDADLLAAHGSGQTGALIDLYAEAADLRPEARAFYLTHAMVFALDRGDPRAEALKAELIALGCESA